MSHVIQMGSARTPEAVLTMSDLATIDESPVRCFDPRADAMVEQIKVAAKDGDSLGGVVEVLAFGVPVGLGSHVHWDRKIDGLLAQALMSIQAVKGVEIGMVLKSPAGAMTPMTRFIGMPSRRHIVGVAHWQAEGGRHHRVIPVACVAMKPLATLNVLHFETVDTATKESSVSFKTPT